MTQVGTFDAKASGVATVSFTITDDDIPEGPEVFYLHLYTLDKNILVGSPNRMQITIRANDDAYGVFSIDEVILIPFVLLSCVFDFIIDYN